MVINTRSPEARADQVQPPEPLLADGDHVALDTIRERGASSGRTEAFRLRGHHVLDRERGLRFRSQRRGRLVRRRSASRVQVIVSEWRKGRARERRDSEEDRKALTVYEAQRRSGWISPWFQRRRCGRKAKTKSLPAKAKVY